MNNQEDISDLKLPNNFEIGETIEGDIGFLHIIVETLKQLRPDTLINIEFLSNELETNWNYLGNHDFSNSEIIPDCQPCSSHSINHTPKRRFNPEIEGKMICTKYDIKLHIIEKQKETEGIYYHKVIDKSGSKFVKDVDYSDTNTIHILNKGDGYFSQIVNIATIRSIEHKKEVEMKLTEFVEDFVSIYEHHISEYCSRLEDRKTKPGKWNDLFNKIVDKTKGGAVGVEGASSKISTIVGINMLQEMLSNLHIYDNRKELKKLINELYIFKEDQSKFREELVKSGIEIFYRFESQFAQVVAEGSWQRAMAKLAEDSVNRIIDYNKRNAKEKFSVALITKGIILGNSKKYKHTSTDIPHIKAGHTLKYKNSLLNTEDLFNEVGLVTIKNDLSADKYYIKRNTNNNKYGYRRLFQWELDNKFELAKKLNIDYHEDKYPTEEYQYILKLDEKTTEEIKNTLLNKINNQDPALIEKRLTKEFERTNYKTEEIFIKLAEQIDENFESLESCISNHHNIIKENLNKIEIQAEKIQKGTKRYHEEDSQQRKKISRSIEKGQKEIKDIFNKMVNRIEEIAINKKSECLKGPISFSVKDPIKLFTGREQELCDLHKKMQESKQTVISQITTISGLGGIGKTELARRYISQYGQFYDNNIIWINGESESTIIQSFNKLAQYKLKISIEDQDKRKKDIKSIVNDVYELFSKRKSLFVFDNAENNKTLKEILPIRVLSHENNIPYILITSRIAEVEWTLWGIEKSITLKVFTDEEAINFVKESLKLKEKNDDILNEQIRELTISLLHKFPLALQQAVAYIKKENEKIKLRKKGEYTITDYLKDYKKETKKLLNTETFKNLDNDYSQTTLKTWKVTTDKIKSNTEYGQIALEILDIIAYIAPNNIPIEMIFSLNIDEEKLWSAVELLYRYSMIKLKEGKCDVHRLVQEVTRLNFIEQDREKEIIEKTFYYLKEAFSNREISETKKQLLPHLEEFYSHLQNWSEKYTETTEMEKYKSDLLIWIANGYESFGNYNKQRSLLIQTLKIQKKYCDPDSLEIAETLERLGLIEEELGYYYEQNDCLKKALRIKRMHYGSDSLEISKTLENLASSYGNLGLEYNNTHYHNKRIINLTNALEIKKKLFGFWSVEISYTLLDLASAYEDLNNTNKQKDCLILALIITLYLYGPNSLEAAHIAETLVLNLKDYYDLQAQKEVLEHILNVMEENYSHDSVELTTTLTYLGLVHGYLGELKTKKELLIRALEIEKKYYGNESFGVNIILGYIASTCEELGDFLEQKRYLKSILEIEKKLCVTNSFKVPIILINLSRAYEKLGDYEKQKDLLEEALIIVKEQPNEMQRLTTVLEYLGLAYGNLGDYQKQKELLEEALEIEKKCYGDKHIEVAITLINLAEAHANMSDYQKQKELLEEALEIEKKCYGDKHIEVAITLDYLSAAYEDLGDYQKQKELLEQALAIKEELCSCEFEIAKTLSDLGNAYENIGEYNKQKELLKKALEIEKKHYGNKHIKVATTMINLGNIYGMLGKYNKQKELLEKALGIEKKHYGDKHIEVAITMTDLGNTYGNLTDYKKQEDLLKRALEIKENYYICDKIKVEEFSEGLKNLSSAYKDSGKSEKQIEILERALKIEEEQLSPESIEITDTLENLGLAYGDLKDWHKQKEFFERSLKIKEREYGSDSLEIIDVLEVLISLYRSLGDFKKQKELLEKSLSIQEKFCEIDYSLQERLFEDGCSLAVKILTNLVYPHKDVAEYQKQCELFKEVLLELNKNYDDDNYEIIMAQVKISLAYGTLDNLIKEEEVFKKALNNLKDYDNEFITIIMKLVYNLSDTSEQINRILTIIDKYHPDLAQKTILSLYQAKELCTPKSNLTSEVLIVEKLNTQTQTIF